ncbi:molybdopterin molybdochelatase [Desulfacinum hydrothermale DSM 13146]|uniref:Molybdopterin molybdenumtransferase n=1 Tax=Desulfacinum hydrothermale DSM 13146 TaxID=1121390 RepID=A0A1W1XAZ7_9BACT|nr:molybdopterin biosynthesis protein [Desulfacinum hydrothermale]SMC21037.1 molybdopterin molybdochelatase [Desulfacinum hydrothermale DSM 13146]
MGRFKRTIYLHMKTLEEARAVWQEAMGGYRTAVEQIATEQALGRVSARPVTARLSVPHYHGAAMDGYAVKASHTFGASDVRPLRLELGRQAVPVDTGDPMPEGTDAVIMIEHAQEVDGTAIEIRQAAFPWQHVRKVGEDIVAGELLLPQQHRLRPADLGAMLAAGVSQVPVFAQPRVWIQPTGTELVPARRAAQAKPGQIVEFNGTVIASLVRENGGVPLLQDVVADDYESLLDAVRRAAVSPADVIVLNAGSSAGSEDYTVSILKELGTLLVHGVAMMPGKPVLLGRVESKPFIGLPGYPVSAIMAFEQFLRPLLHWMQGLAEPSDPTVEAVLGRKMPSKLGLEEFVRVILGRVQGRLVAMPLQRGAGVITSLTRADGLLRIPQEVEGINEGEPIRVRLLRSEDALEKTLIMIGSHDNTVDVLASELKRLDARLHLSSSNVGSLGGLLAVRRGQAHFAGAHLLDPETGDYNRRYVERYLAGTPVRLVRLVRRQQGLLTAPGNPKKIRGIEDLFREDVRFVNRQAGSGTRILLDYELERAGRSPEGIQGYDWEEYTHMAVAVNVLSGTADCGMAIFAAAAALGLDFIPICQECYDLVIPEACWTDPKLEFLLDVIGSERFLERVRALGGYDPSESGTVVGVWDGTAWRETKS